MSLLLWLVVSTAKMDEPVDMPWTVPNLVKTGVSGQFSMSEARGKDKLVLFFFNEACGVTHFYRDRITQLQKDFQPLGYRFLGVRCGRRETATGPLIVPEVKFLNMPFVDDAEGKVMTYFGVEQSVSFAVIDNAGKMRYFGPFDDHVVAAKAKKPLLRNAMREVAKGKPVTVKVGQALGCAILPIAG